MSDDQFTKLFKYMSKRFDELETKIDSKADKADIERIYVLLDSVAKNQETDRQERLMVAHQLHCHEGWITQLADKADLKLSYE